VSFGLKSEEYPTIVKYFGLPWLESKTSDHILQIRWNQGDRLGFLGRWERTLALSDGQGLIKPQVLHMLKNPNQFLDTIAQIEVAFVLLTKGFEIELEAKKSGKTPDIFFSLKNLHIDAVLLNQALSGTAQVVWLKKRLPSAVQEKYKQLPDSCPNVLVVFAPPEVEFDEFEDFFIDIPATFNPETKGITRGKPNGFFYQEHLDGTKIHTKLGAVIMWKDDRRRYILNPHAKSMVSEEILTKIVS
jgi:hypothetical protein